MASGPAILPPHSDPPGSLVQPEAPAAIHAPSLSAPGTDVDPECPRGIGVRPHSARLLGGCIFPHLRPRKNSVLAVLRAQSFCALRG